MTAMTTTMDEEIVNDVFLCSRRCCGAWWEVSDDIRVVSV